MKKQLFNLILAGFLLITLTLVGQNDDYPTKKINGVEYYQYTVEVGEGLFGICRKFDVSQADINKANPEIQNSLIVGQQILIPIHKKKVGKSKKADNTQLEFIQHKVAKKQTLFAISKKYNVSQEDLKKYNPDIDNGLREGIVIKIPKQVKKSQKNDSEKPSSIEEKSQPKSTPSANTKSYITHLVEPDETLYSIGRRFKVKVVDIILLNPGSATKLTVGTELKIPSVAGNTKPSDKKEDSIKSNSKAVVATEKLNENGESSNYTVNNKVIRMAFLLPFMLDQGKKDPSVERFVDFYAGALIAIADAKQKGISFEIYTFDTEKSEEKMTEVLNNPELKTMDLIVGPAFSNQVSLIGDFAKEHKINTLIPFTSKVPDIEYNPYLFQFNPGADAELKFSTYLLSGKYKNANIIFAEIPGVSSFDEGKIWVEGLQNELTKARRTFSRLELTTSDYADFGSVLKKVEKNIIIFNTDKFAYISPFITPLRSLVKENEIILFEQYSWRNQSNIMPLSMHISPFISTLSPYAVNGFNQKYTQLFSQEVTTNSPRYDLMGYDLTNYFILMLHRYGSKFIDKLSSTNFSNGIQSQPQFERSSNGSGFINQRLYLGEDKTE